MFQRFKMDSKNTSNLDQIFLNPIKNGIAWIDDFSITSKDIEANKQDMELLTHRIGYLGIKIELKESILEDKVKVLNKKFIMNWHYLNLRLIRSLNLNMKCHYL